MLRQRIETYRYIYTIKHPYELFVLRKKNKDNTIPLTVYMEDPFEKLWILQWKSNHPNFKNRRPKKILPIQ